MSRPLSGYVVVTLIVSAYELLNSSQDMQKPKDCTSYFLYIVMAFCVINILFAILFQRLVWNRIMIQENIDQFIDGDDPTQGYDQGIAGKVGGAVGGLGAAAKGLVNQNKGEQPEQKERESFAANPGKFIIPTEVVQASFRYVFEQNFAVLAMFFLLIGMCVLSYMGPGAVDSSFPEDCSQATGGNTTRRLAAACTPRCKVNSGTQQAGYFFFGLPFVWTVLYLKCKCCANKVSISKEEMPNYDANYKYEGVAE